MIQNKMFPIAYGIAVALLLLLAAGHMLYTFFAFNGDHESRLWFFSAALGILGSAWIHHLHMQIRDVRIKRAAIGMNIVMLLFSIVLYLVLLELQVLVLCIVYMATLFFALRKV